jgi:FkbM family methyltransferase
MAVVSVAIRAVAINGRWPLLLPEHRAARPEWPYWEKERLASMYAYLGDGGHVVYDIGAEEGDLPALWATWGNRVVLAEPNPRVWPNIRAIWEANDLPHPAGWMVGFAGENDYTPPGVDDRSYSNATDAWPQAAYGPLIGDHGFLNLCERPDVPQARIDTLSDRYPPPSAITIDTEGSELVVLRGAAGVLDHVRPLVWVSIHPEFSIDMYDLTKSDCLQFMADHNYVAEHLATDHEEHWFFTPRPR